MEKQELNSLYGRLADEEASASFRLCSQHVRKIRCYECAHYLQCRRQGAPVSELARFISWLKSFALPSLEAEINEIATEEIRLAYGEPPVGKEDSVYCCIRCRTAKKPERRIFKLNLSAPLEYERLRVQIINAYIRGKRKINHGK